LSIFFGISGITIAKYRSLFLVCYKDYLEKSAVVLGECGITVEVDESILLHSEILEILRALMILEIQYGY